MHNSTHLSQKLEDFFLQKPMAEYVKKDMILTPDDTSIYLYYVQKGYVRSYTITEWGDEKLNVIYKAKEMFPLVWVFDNSPIRRYYEAMGEVILRKCPREEFLTFLEERPDIVFELAKFSAAIIETYSDRIESLEYNKAYARIISLIIHLTKRYGKKRTESSYIIPIAISHKDIASCTAVARETVTRELVKLEKKGLVTSEQHLIVIPDLKNLEDELSAFHSNKVL